MRVTSAADVQAAEAFRTDFHLFDAYWHGAPRRDRRELRLGPGCEAPLEGADDPRRRADAPRTSPRRSSWCRPFAVDVVSGVEAEPGRKDHGEGRGVLRGGGRAGALESGIAMSTAVEERFGPYGGRFVPETLIAALDELSAAWAEAREDEHFQAELADAAARLRRPADAALPRRAALGAGRRPRLPEARGPRPHRRPQDQQRGRPGAAGAADGQDAGDRRDRRRPARRRRRRPPARCFGLECASTWAPRTSAARRPTSSGCGCSAPR